MLSKRVVAISKDPKFQKRLAAGLMAAGGAVETLSQVSELTASRLDIDLCVYHTPGKEDAEFADLLARLKPETPIMVVAPSSDLLHLVDLMKDPRVANVLVADDLDASRLSGVATKLLFGDVFGLEKFLPWGVRIYSMLVGDYQEKSVAIAAVSDFAAAMGVRRKYRESIEQAIDELLMNALYDAPVDQAGKPLFADVPTKTRISLRMEQKAVIQYACDGDRFAVSVRDSFGMLSKETVLRYLDKCLRSGQQIDRKAGGAGLGLYLVANSATQFHINVYPGVATEAIVIFDLTAPKVQLKSFGLYKEKIDVVGRLALAGGGRQRVMASSALLPPPTGASRGMRAALGAALLLVVAAAGVVVWQLGQRPGRGSLVVTSDPPGGAVFVDHARRGTAPARIDDLEAGTYALSVALPGYQPWEGPVRVAAGKEPTAIDVHLLRQKGTVSVQSTPSGAHVLVDGTDSGKSTPATLADLTSGESHRVTLKMTGYRETSQTFSVPDAGQTVTLQLPLQLAPGYGTIGVESEPAGAQVFINDVEQSPSSDGYVLKAGGYELTLRLPGHVDYTERVIVRSGARAQIKARLYTGGALTIRSNIDAKVIIDNRVVGRTPLRLGLPEGTHTIVLRASQPHLYFEFKQAMRKGEPVEKDLKFGRVEVRADNLVAKPPGAGAGGVRELALPTGTQQVPLLDRSTGQERVERVSVSAGETVIIDK